MYADAPLHCDHSNADLHLWRCSYEYIQRADKCFWRHTYNQSWGPHQHQTALYICTTHLSIGSAYFLPCNYKCTAELRPTHHPPDHPPDHQDHLPVPQVLLSMIHFWGISFCIWWFWLSASQVIARRKAIWSLPRTVEDPHPWLNKFSVMCDAND
jgi:hypothetical protein